jgi:hypothetical protein
MDLQQARQIMDRQFDPQHPPRYGDWVIAGQTIAEHYRQHPEKLRRYTTDAVSRPSGMHDAPTSRDVVAQWAAYHHRTKDQPPAYVPFEKSREWLREENRGVKLDEHWANVVGPEAPNPGEEVGGDWVQDLPDGNFYIATNPRTGNAALFRYKQPQQDPGMVGNSRGTTSRTMDGRGPGYYQSLARSAEAQRELAGIKLRAMNAANREAWAKR